MTLGDGMQALKTTSLLSLLLLTLHVTDDVVRGPEGLLIGLAEDLRWKTRANLITKDPASSMLG